MDEGMTTNNAKEALLVIDVQNEYFSGASARDLSRKTAWIIS